MFDRVTFYAALRSDPRVFGTSISQGQVDGIETILAVASGLDREHVAYILATAYHETGRMMRPIKETVMAHHKDKTPTDDQVIARLDRAWSRGQLTWVRTPYWRKDRDGRAWFGRGFVQVTHKENYAKMSDIVGVDLARNPGAALHPETAAMILVQGMVMGVFRGRRLADFAPGDFAAMRAIVNGPDGMADTVAEYAKAFSGALESAGWRGAIDAAPPAPPAREIPAPRGLFEILAALLRRVFGG